MVEALAIGGTGVAVLLAIALIIAIRKPGVDTATLVAHGKARVEADLNQREAEKQWHATQALLDKTAAELQDALARLRTAEAERNAALERIPDAVADSIRHADDPLAELERVLREGTDVPAPGAPGDAAPGDGGQGSPAVRPAGET